MAREVDAAEFDRRIVEFFSQMAVPRQETAPGAKSRPGAVIAPMTNRLSS
jgi:hypothetical protein